MAPNATAKELRRRTRRNWILSPILRLSNELLDEICSHLDKPDLASLSTVCRALQPVAQGGVFRHITITDDEDQVEALLSLKYVDFTTASVMLRIRKPWHTHDCGHAIRSLLRKHAPTIAHLTLTIREEGRLGWLLKSLTKCDKLVCIKLLNCNWTGIDKAHLATLLVQQQRGPHFVVERIGFVESLNENSTFASEPEEYHSWLDSLREPAVCISSFSFSYLVTSPHTSMTPDSYFQLYEWPELFQRVLSLPILSMLVTLALDQTHLQDIVPFLHAHPKVQLQLLRSLRILTSGIASRLSSGWVFEEADFDPGTLTLQLIERCPGIESVHLNALCHELATGRTFPFAALPDTLSSVSIGFYANWFWPPEQYQDEWGDFDYNNAKPFLNSVIAWLSALKASTNLREVGFALDWEDIHNSWAEEELCSYRDQPEERLSDYDLDWCIDRLRELVPAALLRSFWVPESEDPHIFLADVYRSPVPARAIFEECLRRIVDADGTFRKDVQARVQAARAMMQAKGINYRFEIPLFAQRDRHALADQQIKL